MDFRPLGGEIGNFYTSQKLGIYNSYEINRITQNELFLETKSTDNYAHIMTISM